MLDNFGLPQPEDSEYGSSSMVETTEQFFTIIHKFLQPQQIAAVSLIVIHPETSHSSSTWRLPTLPAGLVTFSNTATCQICTPGITTQKDSSSQSRNTQHPQHMESLALRTTQGPTRMDLDIDNDDPDWIRDHEVLENCYKPITGMATPDWRTYSATVLPEPISGERPSMTLTGPTNDRPTMDNNTFKVLGPGHEILVSSRLWIFHTCAAKRKRKRGP
jgi:hypothetical protein